MADATEFVRLIKQASIEAVEASKPANCVVGVVTAANPLTVKISNKILISGATLICPKMLTDHDIELVSDGVSKTYTIKNKLAVGDSVALIKNKGGQQYYILDRVEV